MDKILAEVESGATTICVKENSSGLYDVIRNNKVKHPNCALEDVVRAMSFYLQGALDESNKKYVAYNIYESLSKNAVVMVKEGDKDASSILSDDFMLQKTIYAKTFEDAKKQQDIYMRNKHSAHSPNW